MNDEFSDASMDTSSDMSSDTDFATSSDINVDEGLDTASDTDVETDMSEDDGLDTTSDTDKETDMSEDDGLDTTSDTDKETDMSEDDGLDTTSDTDEETDMSEDDGLDTTSDTDEETDMKEEETQETSSEINEATDMKEEETQETSSETEETTDMKEEETQETSSEINEATDMKEEETQETSSETEETTDMKEEETQETSSEINEATDMKEEETQETSSEIDEATDMKEEETQENSSETEETTDMKEEETQETSSEINEATDMKEEETQETSSETEEATDMKEEETQDTPSEIDEETNMNEDEGLDIFSDTTKETDTNPGIERIREINSSENRLFKEEVAGDVNNTSVDSKEISDTSIFVTGFSNNDNISKNSVDIKDSNQANTKKTFKDKIKDFFNGKKKENPEDMPINVEEQKDEILTPEEDFRKKLSEMTDTAPRPEDADIDLNKKPTRWDYGERIREKDARDTRVKWDSDNDITSKDEVKVDNSQVINDGIFDEIFLSKEERDARKLARKINDSNENLKDTQETVNRFFEDENVMDYLSDKKRFKQKLKMPLSDTVTNMGYQEAAETYNSMSKYEYSKNIVGFNNGKQSFIVVEGKSANEIKHITIHEDIHQKSANDVYLDADTVITRRGISIAGEYTQVNEGITEFYTKRAMQDEYNEDNVDYSSNAKRAEQLERIVGKGNLYKAYFENQPGIIINEFERNFGPAGKEIWNKYNKFCDLAVDSKDENVRTVANQEADRLLQKLETLKIVKGRLN